MADEQAVVTPEVLQVAQPAKLTTFSQLQNDLSAYETKEAATVPITTSEPATQPATTTEPIVEETAQEANVSNFSFGEDIPAVEIQEGKTATVQPVFNFDEELKKVDKKEVLKKLGVNDFTIDMDEYQSKGGKVEDFFNAKGIDYNKVSDEDLIKADLRKQYAGFTPEKIDKLFNAKYGVTELDTDDVKEQKELQLEADGYLKRQAKIAEQQKFKIPDTPILQTDAAYEQWKQQQESQSKLIEQGKQWFTEHEATKSLNESKRVTISLGEGVDPFNFSIERPDLITKVLTDGGETWGKLTSTKTGEPDVQKQQLLTLIAYNPQQFINDIFRYGVQMGERKPVVEGQNATRPQAKVASIDPNATPTYRVGKFGG